MRQLPLVIGNRPRPSPVMSVALFNEIVEQHSAEYVARALQLNLNTVKRWIDNASVPAHYTADLSRLLGKSYIGKSERDKDQFYTKPEVAQWCYQQFQQTARNIGVDLRGYTFIEPSAGCGGFYQLLPPRSRIGIDIEPQDAGLIQSDYLTWQPQQAGKYIVIGNPPFGLRGHLALQFINHSAAFADMVAFILPPLFNSDGKGVPCKRVRGYQLASTHELAPNSFMYPNGKPVDVSAIFQVWTRINTEQVATPRAKTCKKFIKVYSLSDGGTPSSTRNKKMLYACDIYLPSTCFNGMHTYDSFEALPHRRGYGVVIHQHKHAIKSLLLKADWQTAAFRSTNGALNLRTSLIEKVLIKAGYHD